MPPITAMASGALVSAPAPKPMAAGSEREDQRERGH